LPGLSEFPQRPGNSSATKWRSISSSPNRDRLVSGKFTNWHSGEKTAKLAKGAKLVTIKDGPHAVNWTHAEEMNAELVNFLGRGAAKRAASTAR
jgi:pimeloyl-ACP methyl ester carboxylesterase